MAAAKKWEDGGKSGTPPARDLGYEAMAEVLAKRLRVRAHVHAATDVMTLLRLKDEFGFDLTLHHSTEAYKVAPEIAKRGVSAVVLPLGPRIGVTDDAMAGPATLWKAGVKIALHTDHPVINQKWLRLCAALAMRYGLPEDEALKAITINTAQIARVADRVGSLEVGKDADFVIFNGAGTSRRPESTWSLATARWCTTARARRASKMTTRRTMRAALAAGGLLATLCPALLRARGAHRPARRNGRPGGRRPDPERNGGHARREDRRRGGQRRDPGWGRGRGRARQVHPPRTGRRDDVAGCGQLRPQRAHRDDRAATARDRGVQSVRDLRLRQARRTAQR
ncbi:MAG: amidohydrolase family protein [Gemmatimonadetes bacterium]|nr:amidohydrolase family protein [Gemmatimonadota bacterium]